MKSFLKGLKNSFYMVAGYIAVTGFFIFSWIYASNPNLLLEADLSTIFYFAIAGTLFSIWNMYRRKKLESSVLNKIKGDLDE